MELLPPVANLLAITVLVFLIYLPRHHRRDLAVACLGVNVGVMAVSIALTNSAASAGLGLGLFGVLSIIRLRSDELAQHEVAYYFSALALGILGGMSTSVLGCLFMAAIVGVLAVADRPSFQRTTERQVVQLDRAITDHHELTHEVANRLGARILGITVHRVDFVSDTTLVEVRYRPGSTLALPKRVEALS